MKKQKYFIIITYDDALDGGPIKHVAFHTDTKEQAIKTISDYVPFIVDRIDFDYLLDGEEEFHHVGHLDFIQDDSDFIEIDVIYTSNWE